MGSFSFKYWQLKPHKGTFLNISTPIWPFAISLNAATVGLFLVSIFGTAPCANCRALYVADRAKSNRFGILFKQSSMVILANLSSSLHFVLN